MTYNSRPMFGIKESFYGPAAYAQAQFEQSIKPQPAQSLSVGDSKNKYTIEGYEKTIYPQYGTKQELQGAAAISQAQAEETWRDEATAQYKYVLLVNEPDDWDTNFSNYYEKVGNEYQAVEAAVGGGAPEFVKDKYYKKVRI